MAELPELYATDPFKQTHFALVHFILIYQQL